MALKFELQFEKLVGKAIFNYILQNLWKNLMNLNLKINGQNI
jgi:hypothetical protein